MAVFAGEEDAGVRREGEKRPTLAIPSGKRRREAGGFLLLLPDVVKRRLEIGKVIGGSFKIFPANLRRMNLGSIHGGRLMREDGRTIPLGRRRRA